MTRTPTRPFDDRSMWRRLVGRSHPDAGGDHELFIWTVATRDAICGGEKPKRERREEPFRRQEASTSSAGERVPFNEYSDVEGPLYNQQRRGATYRTLAAIGHTVAMSKAERVGWYRIAETIPLSQRHAGHILSRLKGQ